jgi:hypothetical protein
MKKRTNRKTKSPSEDTRRCGCRVAWEEEGRLIFRRMLVFFRVQAGGHRFL